MLGLRCNLGINLIDTAPAYGTSESRIGKLLSDRARWVISSKVGEVFENGQSSHDFSAEAARASVSRSLERLRTDYLDVVLIHTSDDDVNDLQAGALEELMRLKEEGLIKSIGASTKTVDAGLAVVDRVDVLMLTYPPDDLTQQPVMDAALKNHTGILVKKALNSGHASRAGENLTFIKANQAVSSIIVGTLNPKHLESNADAVMR